MTEPTIEQARIAWEVVREIILHEDGPLEVNDVLGIIDEHDPWLMEGGE